MNLMKPNILLIISDEQSPRTVGCYGADFMRTPNIDRLARQGTLFEHAYCAFPLCVPGRNALMSGQQCHKIKAYDIGSPLAPGLPTWAHMLGRLGYRTPLYGKMHFLGADQLHGFDEHKHELPHQIDGFRWGEEVGNGTAYSMFTKIHFTDNLNTVGRKDYNYTFDTGSRESAVAFLDSRRGNAQPFCLTVGFNFPHYPMVVDRDVFTSYRDKVPPPVTGGWRHPRNDHMADNVWGFNKMTPDQTRAAREAYCAMGTMLDTWIGDVLAALQRSGHADNTVIIYTTDHGDMWGEHGMWCKNTFYEDSAAVPLIVSAPKCGVAAGRRISAPVSHLDLYPTLRDIVDAADWTVPLDGRSLWPALTGVAALDPQPVFCEYYACDVRGPERMVRDGDFKLNYYHNWGMELFDLASDPNETRNVLGDPAYHPVRQRLAEVLFRDWDPEKIAADIRIEQNRRTLLGEALRRQKGGEFHSGL